MDNRTNLKSVFANLGNLIEVYEQKRISSRACSGRKQFVSPWEEREEETYNRVDAIFTELQDCLCQVREAYMLSVRKQLSRENTTRGERVANAEDKVMEMRKLMAQIKSISESKSRGGTSARSVSNRQNAKMH